MDEGKCFGEQPDLSLDEMIEGLQNAHSVQQMKLSELNATIDALSRQSTTTEVTLKRSLGEQSLLSKESIWVSHEIKRLENDVIKSQSEEIEDFIIKKIDEEKKLSDLKEKLAILTKSRDLSKSRVLEHKNVVETYNSKFVDEVDFIKLENRLSGEMENKNMLMGEIEASQAALLQASCDIAELEDQENSLASQETSLRQQIWEKQQETDKVFNTQINTLNNKIQHLQGSHAAHKNQLRELNQIISSQNRSC